MFEVVSEMVHPDELIYHNIRAERTVGQSECCAWLYGMSVVSRLYVPYAVREAELEKARINTAHGRETFAFRSNLRSCCTVQGRSPGQSRS